MDITPVQRYHIGGERLKPQTKHWLEMAEYDLATAEAMFKTRRYVYVIFMCHLCLEKALKGCVVEFANVFPPYTHNLTELSEIARLAIPTEVSDFVLKISKLSVVTRYPEDLKRFQRAQAKEYLEQTREAFAWLRQRLTSSES